MRSCRLVLSLGKQLCIDEGDDRSSLIGGAAGDGGLHTFAGWRPAEIADVPLAVGEICGVDARNIFDVLQVHDAPRFRVATDAVGVEEMAFGRIRDNVENLLDAVCGRRRWCEEFGGSNSVAIGDGKTGR